MLPNIIKDCGCMNFKNVLEYNFTVYDSDIVDNFLSMYHAITLKMTTNILRNLLYLYLSKVYLMLYFNM